MELKHMQTLHGLDERLQLKQCAACLAWLVLLLEATALHVAVTDLV
jgi:hypothetical protein